MTNDEKLALINEYYNEQLKTTSLPDNVVRGSFKLELRPVQRRIEDEQYRKMEVAYHSAADNYDQAKTDFLNRMEDQARRDLSKSVSPDLTDKQIAEQYINLYEATERVIITEIELSAYKSTLPHEVYGYDPRFVGEMSTGGQYYIPTGIYLASEYSEDQIINHFLGVVLRLPTFVGRPREKGQVEYIDRLIEKEGIEGLIALSERWNEGAIKNRP